MMFKVSNAVVLALMANQAYSHGVVTSIQGANGVTMPGLGVTDGTPRDCSSAGCGSQADTSIIRQNDRRAQGSPLGRTTGGGAVSAAAGVAAFMGTGGAAAGGAAAGGAAAGGAAAGGQGGRAGGLAALRGGAGRNQARDNEDENDDCPDDEDEDMFNADDAATAHQSRSLYVRLADSLSDLTARQFGRQRQGAAAGAGASAAAQGVKTPQGTSETGVAAAAGKGASSGLPTVGADGVISMTFHQVNQDGAGPLTAMIDPTSGGTDAAAFQPAQMIQDVPGRNGLSRTTTSDFQIKVQMPAGMTCSGTVAGQTGVCVVRVNNQALAGPFGGSAVFQQAGATGAAKTRRSDMISNIKRSRIGAALLG